PKSCFGFLFLLYKSSPTSFPLITNQPTNTEKVSTFMQQQTKIDQFDIEISRYREMKSMEGEVELEMEAERAWRMYIDNDTIGKINPEMLSLAKYLEGDGSPGSIRLFQLGPAVQNYVKESTQKIEKIETGRSVTYRVVAGELSNMYNPYRVTFSFIPSNNHKCIARWQAEFEPISPLTPLPEQARDTALAFLKSFDKFERSCNH
ncbi:MLP-like protein 423, partial [Linum grandiflorum]